MQQQFSGHQRDVVGAGQMLRCGGLVVQPGAVDEVCVLHAQLFGFGIHFFYKTRLAAGDVLRHGAGAVVGGGNRNGFDHFLYRHRFSHLQIYLAASLGRGGFGSGDGVLPRDFAGIYGLHNQKQGHDLGDTGRSQPLMGIGLVQDGSRRQIHEDCRRCSELQIHSACRQDQRPCQNAEKQYHDNNSFTHIHPSRFCYRLCPRGQEYENKPFICALPPAAAGDWWAYFI